MAGEAFVKVSDGCARARAGARFGTTNIASSSLRGRAWSFRIGALRGFFVFLFVLHRCSSIRFVQVLQDARQPAALGGRLLQGVVEDRLERLDGVGRQRRRRVFQALAADQTHGRNGRRARRSGARSVVLPRSLVHSFCRARWSTRLVCLFVAPQCRLPHTQARPSRRPTSLSRSLVRGADAHAPQRADARARCAQAASSTRTACRATFSSRFC